MDGYLRQSTASQTRLIGPFVDDTDFKTAKTGLTIANTDIKLRANGTTLSTKNSGGGTHQANGNYSVTWDATDTANVGELKYSVLVSGALQVFGSYVVLEEAVYDAMFAASANAFTGAAGSSKASGVVLVDTTTTLTNLPAITANWLTAAGIADNAIDSATFAADTGLRTIRANTAQAGASTTITLDASASAVDDFYKDCLIVLTGGTGVGQSRIISGYVGSTKVATVSAWATNPDNTTTFAIRPASAITIATATIAAIATAVWASGTRTLTSISGLGIALATKLTKYFQLAMRKDSAVGTDLATELGEINANTGTGTGTFNQTTDSLEQLGGSIGIDVYYAKAAIEPYDADRDLIVVLWFKNGVLLESGITDAALTIRKTDGTLTITADPMTEIGVSQTFKYLMTVNRIGNNEIEQVIASATIDGGTRKDVLLGRKPVAQ